MISARLPETWCSAASTVTAARMDSARSPDDRERGPQYQAGRESVAARQSACRACRKRLEQAPRPLRERWRHEQEAGERQEHHGDRVQQILRQAERSEDARGRQGEHHERERKTDGDTERPAATTVAPLASTTGTIGSTHGDRNVARPATTAARTSVRLTQPS